MNWNRDPYDGISETAGDLAHPPAAGKAKLVLLGIALPLALAVFAIRGWINEESLWLGGERGTTGTKITGDAAAYLSVTWLSAAAFCHFRWFWGSLGWQRTFVTGIILAIVCGLGSCSTAFFIEMSP